MASAAGLMFAGGWLIGCQPGYTAVLAAVLAAPFRLIGSDAVQAELRVVADRLIAAASN